MSKITTTMVLDAKNFNSGINRCQRQIEGFANKNLTLNGILGQVSGAIGKMGVALGVAEVAGKTFNAMLDNSQTFGDSVRNSLSAMQDTLGTLAGSLASMDFSPFHDGLDGIISRAYDAAAAMDELWNVQQSAGLIRTMENANFQEALTTLRDKSASKEDRAAAESSARASLTAMAETAEVEIAKTWDVVRKKFAVKTGLNEKDITQDAVLSALTAMGKKDGTARVQAAADEISNGRPSRWTQLSNGGRRRNDSYELEMEAFKYNHQGAFIQNAASELFGDADVEKLTNLAKVPYQLQAQQAQLERTLNRATTTTTTTTPKSPSGVKSSLSIGAIDFDPLATTQSMASLRAELALAKKDLENATNAVDAGAAEATIAKLENAIAAQPLALRVGIDANSVAELQTSIVTLTETMRNELPSLQLNIDTSGATPVKDAKKTQEAWTAATTAIAGASSALNSMDNKGLNVAGTIMQAVANIALGFAKASASPATSAAGVWGWIAAATAGLATMTATIATVKKTASGSFAQGGVVPGSYNGGIDNTYVYASPGELILNRAQQQNIAGQLDGGMGGGVIELQTNGEKMFGAINTYMRRTGRKWSK